jgi:hypothetical protein
MDPTEVYLNPIEPSPLSQPGHGRKIPRKNDRNLIGLLPGDKDATGSINIQEHDLNLRRTP